MAISPFDENPEQSPDVRCTCGAVVTQALCFSCKDCKAQFEVACTPKGFWRWVRTTASTDCPSCRSASTQVEPCLHWICPECGRDARVPQGI